MQIFKQILCPVDFSEYSALAIRYASALAKDNDAKLILYHSIPDLTPAMSYVEGQYLLTVNDALASNASLKLEEYTKTFLPPGLNVERLVMQGNPAESIVDLARNNKIDLVVMGTHGATGYERFLMGSVTNRVLHKSSVPVLVVSKTSHHFIHENGRPQVKIPRILCPVDFDANNLWITGIALAFARKYNSELLFLHVIDSRVQDREKLEARAMLKLRALAGAAIEEQCKVKILIGSGEPGEVIFESSEQQNADLVVMGHHTRNPIEEIFLGSIARRVVTDSKRPVLVARTLIDTLKT